MRETRTGRGQAPPKRPPLTNKRKINWGRAPSIGRGSTRGTRSAVPYFFVRFPAERGTRRSEQNERGRRQTKEIGGKRRSAFGAVPIPTQEAARPQRGRPPRIFRARLGAPLLLHADALLPVHGLARHQVAGHQRVLLPAGDEDALVAVLLDHHLGPALHPAAPPPAAAPAASAATPGCPPAWVRRRCRRFGCVI